MPVDLTFDGTHTINVDDNIGLVTLPFTLQHDVACLDPLDHISITPDSTDPINDLYYALIETATGYTLELAIPFGRTGTMTVAGEGTVFRTDTDTYDTINSGMALLTYDTRIPEIIDIDAPGSCRAGTTCHLIVEFNRNVTFDVTDPSDAHEVFTFEGTGVASGALVYAYIGTGTPRLPIVGDLMSSSEWMVMRRDTYAQYFVLEFTSAETDAAGVFSVCLNPGVAVSFDGDDVLLAVSPPPPQPQPQMQLVPVIEKIATQFLTLEEEFEVEIDITGGTADEASVRGLALGSYAVLDETNQKIIIRGTAHSLLTDKTWVCNASGPNGDAETVNQTYNYVQLAPVVSSLGKQNIYIGIPNQVLIPISNGPGDGTVITELIGLDHELIDNDGDGVNDHMRIFGTPPTGANFSITEGSFSVMAMNTGGDHTAVTEFRTRTNIDVYTSDIHTNNIYVWSAAVDDGGQATAHRTFTQPDDYQGMALDGTDMYGVKSNRFLDVFPADTADGGTATASRSFRLSGTGNPTCIALIGSHIYVFQESRIYRYAANTGDGQMAQPTRTWTVPSGRSYVGMTTDGINLHCLDTDDLIDVIDPNTPDNQTIDPIRTFMIPTATYRAMALVGSHLYCVSNASPVDRIDAFSAGTADGEMAEVAFGYSLPTGNNNANGIAFAG